ncbi:MAG: hypothetical protein MJ154_00855 [Candidatus Saccharibacteria bacterium]|nr:hypothetical protein [Candidatus Saccharibacteria bacterium]
MNSSDNNAGLLSNFTNTKRTRNGFSSPALLAKIITAFNIISAILQIIVIRLISIESISGNIIFIGVILSHVALAIWQISFTSFVVIRKKIEKGKAASYLILGSVLHIAIYNILLMIGLIGLRMAMFDGSSDLYEVVGLYEVIITVCSFPIFLIALITLLSQKDTAINSSNKLLDFDSNGNIIEIEEVPEDPKSKTQPVDVENESVTSGINDELTELDREAIEDSSEDSLVEETQDSEIEEREAEENSQSQSVLDRYGEKAPTDSLRKELPAAISIIFITIVSLCALYINLGGPGCTQIILWILPSMSILLGTLILLKRNTVIGKASIFALCFVIFHSISICGLHVVKTYDLMPQLQITRQDANVLFELILYVASLIICSKLINKKMIRNEINSKIVLLLSLIPVVIALVYATQISGCNETMEKYRAELRQRSSTSLYYDSDPWFDSEYMEKVVICEDLLN